MNAPEEREGARWRHALFDDVERRRLQQQLRVASAGAIATALTIAALAFFALCAFTTACHA